MICISEKTLEWFKLPRDPFCGEMEAGDTKKNVFDSSSHAFAEIALWNVIKKPGMAALVGPVGAGKSTLIRVIQMAMGEGSVYRVIETAGIGAERLNISSLLDSICRDLTGKDPWGTFEMRARQAREGISEALKEGLHPVWFLDEADDYPVTVLKNLKRLYDHSGVRNLGQSMAIVLVGLPRLATLIGQNVELDSVRQRCQIIELKELGRDMPEYLDFKLKRMGSSLERIFEPGAVAVLAQHPASHYPRSLNNLASLAMEDARAIQERVVSEEAVREAFRLAGPE